MKNKKFIEKRVKALSKFGVDREMAEKIAKMKIGGKK
jgi:hypothetical protein